MPKDSPAPETEFLTLREAAELLHIKSISAMYEHVRSGRIPASKPLGRWLIRRSDLEAMLTVRANPTPRPSDEDDDV